MHECNQPALPDDYAARVELRMADGSPKADVLTPLVRLALRLAARDRARRAADQADAKEDVAVRK
jgi:hypothetical protein